MAIGSGRRWERRRIHELAGGPVLQLNHGRRQQFATACHKTTRRGGNPYDIRLHQFHGGANAVMHIEVEMRDEPVSSRRDEPRTERVVDVSWRVIRTLTDPEAHRERSRVKPKREEDRPPFKLTIRDRSPITGRITL